MGGGDSEIDTRPAGSETDGYDIIIMFAMQKSVSVSWTLILAKQLLRQFSTLAYYDWIG